MLIDKLFYKKFYEEPLLWPALRRGLLLYFAFAGLVSFRLLGGLNWSNAFLILFLVVVLEILAVNYTDKKN